jgi:hypothetical protein
MIAALMERREILCLWIKMYIILENIPPNLMGITLCPKLHRFHIYENDNFFSANKILFT